MLVCDAAPLVYLAWIRLGQGCSGFGSCCWLCCLGFLLGFCLRLSTQMSVQSPTAGPGHVLTHYLLVTPALLSSSFLLPSLRTSLQSLRSNAPCCYTVALHIARKTGIRTKAGPPPVVACTYVPHEQSSNE